MKSSAEYLAIKLNSSYGNLEDIDHILAVVVAGHLSNFAVVVGGHLSSLVAVFGGHLSCFGGGGSGRRTFVQ